MTIKDWIELLFTLGIYVIAIIAGWYAKSKAKINRATKTGQILDVVGKLATSAVHEAEHLDMDNSDKRQYASDVIRQGLQRFGIKNVTVNTINGEIEKAVNTMHIANQANGLEETPVSAPKEDIAYIDSKDIDSNVTKNLLVPTDLLKDDGAND